MLAAGAALVAATGFAGFEIKIDPAKVPIRDARQTPCASLIGYAGSFNAEKMGHIYDNDSYWYDTNRWETAAAMKEAGAWQQRLWSANVWFARRHPVTAAERAEVEEFNAKSGRYGKKKRLRTQSNPKAAFELWKANDMKVLLVLECWNDNQKTQCLEFVKWIVDNDYKGQVAGFELGNESFFSDKYPNLAPRWTEVVNEIWRMWPKVPMGICLCELFERNPDLTQVRNRMLSDGAIKKDGYFSASDFNRYSTQFVIGMSNCLDKISHVVYHAYGAETPYSCSYYGFQRFRNYLNAMPELKGKRMWLTEIRPRSDEDNRCQRIFRESLIMGHYALMAICQPDMDGFNHHELHAQSGGIYMSNGREWTLQWRDGKYWGGACYPDFRAPYGRPRLEVGSLGVVYRIFTEALKEHPVILSHGTSKAQDTEDAFFTSARVMDQVYARRRALREGKKPGILGGAPAVEGEVEWVASFNDAKRKDRLCLLMVNTKGEEVEAVVEVAGMEFAAPTYNAVMCPAEHVDDRAVPGEGHWWRQVAWEDTNSGWGEIKMSAYEGISPKCDALTVKIAPHTVQSVIVPLRPQTKK